MASAHLEFVPPNRDGFIKLLIFEAPSINGTLVKIETVTDIGTYPSYIGEYTTALATSKTNFFAIQWEDAKGAQTEISARIMGGTESLAGQIVERVLERDRSLDKNVVLQEAEGAIQWYYGEGKDPYDLVTAGAPMPSYRILNGLAYLTMARIKIVELAMLTGEQNNISIGLVSLRTSTQGSRSSQNYVQGLLDLANDALGLNVSLVLQIDSVHQHHHRRIEMFTP